MSSEYVIPLITTLPNSCSADIMHINNTIAVSAFICMLHTDVKAFLKMLYDNRTDTAYLLQPKERS